MIGGKPPHFNSLFLNQSCINIVVGDSAVLPSHTNLSTKNLEMC